MIWYKLSLLNNNYMIYLDKEWIDNHMHIIIHYIALEIVGCRQKSAFYLRKKSADRFQQACYITANIPSKIPLKETLNASNLARRFEYTLY